MQVKPAPASCYRKPRVDETNCPTAKERLRLLGRIEALVNEDRIPLSAALKAVELRRSTYYDWRKALNERGVRGLVPKSRRPRRCSQPRWTKRDERRVLAVRDARPYCGKRRIHHELKRQKSGCAVSVSTVGRILERAVARGRIKPCAFHCHGRVKAKRKRDFASGHARRWKHGDRAAAPGELVQTDHMTVRADGVEFKEFRAVCPFTRRMFARVYSRATAFNARRFFRELVAFMRVHSAQVDGGSEFMAEFEDECAKRAVELAVLPPNRPQLNGCVERANGTSRAEFWSLYAGDLTVEAVNAELDEYLRYYNDERPHTGIGMMTPNDYYATLSPLPEKSEMS